MDTIDTLKEKALAIAFNHAAFEGWTDGLFATIAKEADANPALLREAFPNGILDIILYHSQLADESLLRATHNNPDFASKKIREKIAHAVMLRLEANKHEREAIRKAASFMAKPWRAHHATKALYATMDSIWRAAGDTAADFNFYSKRATLAAIYLPTLHVWFDDHTENLQQTRDFLDRRIDNIMQFEKLKAKCRNGTAQLKNWLPEFLRA